ncbi:SMP-30/gluconolactonase/LRE family protein [Paenibacillus sacheonensis]|uniref:SMP-30/gluconolactonase/LRE family protein n=1 Tax=Paenibacillus sacheonensis TaxID=742054 RepID=A0A7X4YLB7_9BACL|nr:SMP-30/gluconolactonase/LRE family protein [Paenibacillus sacheonensis]MBM7568346.1 sugar lactone lactonase YvrE [Paenibacillus sacheonensis]NBC68471.1 SMP-30/gluconolactonase/LRE family protein [Paenibacillus sacheonensis]
MTQEIARQFARKAELLLDAKAILAEGPHWNANQNKLYWVDIQGLSFGRLDLASGRNEQFPIGKTVGAVVSDAVDGEIVYLATRDGFERYDCRTGGLTGVADPEADKPANRFNDGKCDAAGRFWAGTMEDAEANVSGALYVLDNDLSCRKTHENVGVSNGIAWNADETEMYYIDSMKGTVTAFDYDASSGSIAAPRIIIDFAGEQGAPDGMTIDAEGMLWIAHWGGWQVSRWNPRTGEKLGGVYVPAAKATSCTFGGDELDVMYITTARIGLTAEQLEEQPHSGGIFVCRPGVTGTPTHAFRGAAGLS